jgi:hypothetical protein
MRHLMTHGGEQLRRSAPCPLCYQPLVARELRLVQVRPRLCAPGTGLLLVCGVLAETTAETTADCTCWCFTYRTQ